MAKQFTKAKDPSDGKVKFVLAKHGSTAKAFVTVGASVTMPTKSQIITLNMDGTSKNYRVLKINGSVAEVFYMSDDMSSAFGSSRVYEGSTLDSYLNNTWYNTLTSSAKNAVIDKTFFQDLWASNTSGNPVYTLKYGPSKPGSYSSSISLINNEFGNELTRHVYTLSVQDVLDYVADTSFGRDGKLDNYNFWKMFWDEEVSHDVYIRLMSAYNGETTHTYRIYGRSGTFDFQYGSTSTLIRPAFQIDLSKIDFTIVE